MLFLFFPVLAFVVFTLEGVIPSTCSPDFVKAASLGKAGMGLKEVAPTAPGSGGARVGLTVELLVPKPFLLSLALLLALLNALLPAEVPLFDGPNVEG